VLRPREQPVLMAALARRSAALLVQAAPRKAPRALISGGSKPSEPGVA